jgi:drug/metabolite transporter (DMT)-like permease
MFNDKEKKFINEADIGFMLLLLCAMTLWGIAWPAAKLISGSMSLSVIVFWRFLCAFIGVLPFVFVFRASLKISLKSFFLLLLSAFLIVIYNHLFFGGLKKGFTGSGGVLVTTTNPLITYIIWLFLYRKKTTVIAVVGLILGLAGGLILLELWSISIDQLLKTGNLFFIIASIVWAFLTITSQKTQQEVHFITYCFYLYGLAALFELFFALPGNIGQVFKQDITFWICLSFLGFLSIAFASTVYFLASKKLGSHRASSFIFIVPSAALISSFFILGEIPSIFTIIGGILAITAIYIVNTQKRKKTGG